MANSYLIDKARVVNNFWINSLFINKVRHFFYGIYARLHYAYSGKNSDLRLNLGCGDKKLAGYINIDFRKTSAADIVCDTKSLPYPSNSASVIEAYHLIEHLPRNEALTVLKEWHRVLKKEGVLVIECPDLDAAVRDYLAGNDQRLDSIFGLQRFPGDLHQFGYNFARLQKILETAGFCECRSCEPLDYHAKYEPCLRVECKKI